MPPESLEFIQKDSAICETLGNIGKGAITVPLFLTLINS